MLLALGLTASLLHGTAMAEERFPALPPQENGLLEPPAPVSQEETTGDTMPEDIQNMLRDDSPSEWDSNPGTEAIEGDDPEPDILQMLN
jgi:hypothetical protein